MPSSSLYTTLYDWLKPFLETAKSKGFHVSPDTHIQIFSVLVSCSEKISDEQVLFDYISPLIAKNKEDYLLLKTEYETWCGREKMPTYFPPKPPVKKWIFIVAATCIALLILLFFIFRPHSEVNAQSAYNIEHSDVKQPVYFTALKKGTATSSDTSYLTFIWKFGDGAIDSVSGGNAKHIYKQPGTYQTSLTLLSRSSHIHITEAIHDSAFTLCKPSFSVVQQPDGELEKGEQATFTASYNSQFPPSGKNTWKINGKTVQEDKPSLTWQFDSAGNYTISYIDREYNANTGCDTMDETSVSVKAPSTLAVAINQTGANLQPPVKVSDTFQYIVFALMGLVTLLYYVVKRKLNKNEGKNTARSSSVLAKLKGKNAPYEIPFVNHEDAIDDEPLIPLLAKNFKRRVPDENIGLNIPLTIAGALKSEGFLLPVFTAKTKPSEYLILIDKREVKSSAVKLFEFLVNRFSKSDIYIETFYIYDKPDYCFNAYYSKGIYITRLYDLYPDHTLLIFGNGYPFIDKYYPALNEALSLLFAKWNTRAIFTPVPYADWSSKEKLVQQTFLLLPADLVGQLLLFNFIDKPETYREENLQQLHSLYKTKGVNVNRAEKIKKYLNDDFLFQWLCALAISPSIHWQTMLGIGDALQKERYGNKNIQYSSLLKLVRIKWMNDASFPEEVRLELLKELEPQNEKIARQAMIGLMDEALQKLDENSFAYEEMYLQQMTDKFILYASDSDEAAFKNYKQAHDEFEALWKDKKITDVVLKEYLQKGKEDGENWSTLIGNNSLSDKPGSSISVDELFRDKTVSQTKQLRRWLYVESTVCILCTIALIGVSVFKNQLNNTSFNQALHLVSADETATVPFTFNVAFNQCFTAQQMQKDSASFTLDFGNNNLLKLAGKDSSIQKEIPYAWLNQKAVQLHVGSDNESYNLDSTFIVTTSKMSLSIGGCKVFCNDWKEKESANLEPYFTGDWYDNSIVNGNRETYQPTHIERNSINGEVITGVYGCALNQQLRKVVTVEQPNKYHVFYLSQMPAAGEVSFRQSSSVYKNFTEAGKDTLNNDLTTLFSLVTDSSRFANSHTFVNSFNGSWRDLDSTNIFDIQSSTNTITVNKTNAYTLSAEQQLQTNWGKPLDKLLTTAKGVSAAITDSKAIAYTLTAEQQLLTSWGKPLYKLSLTAKGASVNKNRTFYVLVIDSAKGLVSEEVPGAAGSVLKNSLGIFRLFRKQTAAGDVAATLPPGLNEIWHSGTSNRLITLFLPKNVIFYSVNDTKTYGTYNIAAVSLLSDGTYKIVTKTNGGYKLFFIKNVTSTSFDLSVCQNFLTTKEEAAGKTAADCDAFNTMSLYYENNPSAIYLPVSFSNNLVASQKAKLDKITKAVNNKTATVNGFAVELSYTPANLSNTVTSMNSFLQKNGITNKITNNDVNSSTINRPFTRSYIEIKTVPAANVSTIAPVNSNNEVTQETENKKLGNILINEKNGAPDNSSLQLIEAIAKQLNSDTASRVKLTCYYKDQNEQKTAQQYMSTVINLFRKSGVAVSRANAPLQIETSFLQSQSVQQQTQSKNASSSVAASTIVVTGVNFPATFISPQPQKKY